ncbi:helix-turn-helix transcriptional regulator [Psychrobacter sp. I-STPA10]|uniref:helix-turn-helix transcriptional regulator n=1 Tax=Psychrobacter sp. I-STPA10 TaxID=2585769 RepID=UPI001E5A1521|nr:helix-turn-helix transcriptional regulator [Psychrobacter sp. I-STPA10]
MKEAEYELLHDLQQLNMDDAHWFELYMSLLSYGDNQHLASHNFHERLEQALAFRQQLMSQWRLFHDVFDTLPFAVLFLDINAQVVQCNQKATHISHQSELQRFILKHIIPKFETEEANSFVTAKWQTGGADYHIGVLIYHQHHKVHYIAYIYDHHLRVNTDTLKNMYQLSSTESHIIQVMLEHGNSKTAAENANINVETLRSHLKSIMRKTQTHSQSELMVKLLAGTHWLGEISNQLDDKNKEMLEDLTNKPLISLGCPKGRIIVIFPSFFGILWDMIADKALTWHQWGMENRCHLLICNSHLLIAKKDWKTHNLISLCQQLAEPINHYLQDYRAQTKQGIYLLGIHSAAAVTLNMSPYLVAQVRQIQLVSPILPSPYMTHSHFLHKEYQNVAKANKVGKKIWFSITPQIVDAAAKNKHLYFAKRLSYQRYQVDRQKVQYWIEHAYLAEYFCKHCQLASHKIAFESALLDSKWQFAQAAYDIHCIVGEYDAYCNIDSVNHFADSFDNVHTLILKDAYYSLSLEQWQWILKQAMAAK